MKPTRLGISLTVLALGILVLGSPEAWAQGRGVLYASVKDSSGAPVLDMEPDDFDVKIGDTALEVVSAEIDSQPMKIALLVDNGDSMSKANADVALRRGLVSFLDTLNPVHEVGLFTIARNVQRLENFTDDRDDLKEKANEIFSDSGAGVKFLEGIMETWDRRFDDDDPWPVFVVVVTDAPEGSRFVNDEDYNEFVNDIARRGATVNVVFFVQGGGAQGQMQEQYGVNLTENTGGTFETINSATGLEEMLAGFAGTLNEHFEAVSNRYRVVYEVPRDAPAGGITVTMPRGGLDLSLYPDRRRE